jgi:hypothetical protein
MADASASDLNADDVMKADSPAFLQALRDAPDGHNSFS